MAILAEELGFVGVLAVLGLILWMVIKALHIGNHALERGRAFDGFLSYSIGIWFSFQTAVNIGASAGILPTKGLTLPLVSYGGSSLIIMSIAVAILLRIDFELRVDGVQALNRGEKRKAKASASNAADLHTPDSNALDSNASGSNKSAGANASPRATPNSSSAKAKPEDEGKAGIKAILARVAEEADND